MSGKSECRQLWLFFIQVVSEYILLPARFIGSNANLAYNAPTQNRVFILIVKRSVINSIARALSGILLLSLLTTSLALLTLSGSLRDAEAINVAGSLRMQSYRLAWDATSDPQLLAQHLQLYQETLNAPALQHLNHFWVPQEVANRYRNLLAAWPDLRDELNGGNSQIYQQQVANYVSELDRFVLGLQRYAELKMRLVAASSFAGLVAIVSLALWTIHFMRRRVVAPLNELVIASRYVEQGNFAFPALNLTLDNELGVLSAAFHGMAARLQAQYQLLETRVREKTEDLTEANRTLSLLYDASQALSASALGPTVFQRVLTLLLERERFTAIALDCGDEIRLSVGSADETLPWRSLPLLQEDRQTGELRWQTRHGALPPTLMPSLANMLGRTLWVWQTQKQYQQMLLIEERATIARELHDSLAQALSFLRIQLTLLRRTVDKQNLEAQTIIADFDRALSDAYRQLRELLATFRLSIEQADLAAAMQAMIASLQEQTSAEICFDYQPGLQSLEAQQQVHVLQIAREAVLNAIRHAGAQTIRVVYQRSAQGDHLLTIDDDGIGIATAEEPPGHYGLNIMNERAARLAGTLVIRPQAQGTQIVLRFPPRPAHPLE